MKNKILAELLRPIYATIFFSTVMRLCYQILSWDCEKQSSESKAGYKVIKEVSTKLNPFARLSHALWSPTNTLAAAQGLAVELVVDLEDSYHDMRRKRGQPWCRVWMRACCRKEWPIKPDSLIKSNNSSLVNQSQRLSRRNSFEEEETGASWGEEGKIIKDEKENSGIFHLGGKHTEKCFMLPD